MITFIQFLITGLRLGSVYALIALGYTMVYGIIKLINFAHGDFIMVGGYSLFFTIPVLMGMGLPGWLAVIPAVIICALVGVLVELLAYRPVRKTGNNLTCLITAIAMSFVLENLAQAIPPIGPDPKVPYTLFSTTVSIGGVSVSYATVITIIVSAVIMVALYLFTQKARIGCAMRCVSEDKDASTLMGINVNHTILITFAIGAGLAAVAALMYIAQYPKVYTTMGATLGIYAFVAAVLGGIGSLPGAMLGGLLIGIVQSGANTYISSSMSDTFVYLILIVGFSYFYATIQYNPVEVANNLKKNGGFIPGFRPGRPTADFIRKVINKVTLFGALYLGIIAVLPVLLGTIMSNTRFSFGGTSIIIVVSVALETVAAIEAQMLMRNYSGFLEK